MKYYITKYALTKGIMEFDGEEVGDGMIRGLDEGRYTYYHKGEFFESKHNAVDAAEELRIKKLKALDREIKKISALKFQI